MSGNRKTNPQSQQGGKRLYARLLALVVIVEAVIIGLDRWEVTAEHLGIPSVEEVKEIITGRPPALNIFGPEIISSMDAIELLGSPEPLPPNCIESAFLDTWFSPEELGEAAPAEGSARRWDKPLFVLADSPTTVHGLKIAPLEGVTSSVGLSFIVSNPGRYGSIVMDNLDLDVEGIGVVDPGEVRMQVTWTRRPVSPYPPPPGGLGELTLEVQGALTSASGEVRTVLSRTGSSELNFELKDDEKVVLHIELTLADPGLYRVTPIVRVFDSRGNRFDQYGPSISFAWTRLSSGPFGVEELIPSHSPECSG